MPHKKVIDQAVLDRLRVLKYRDGLTDVVIGQRLGLHPDHIRKLLRQLRAAGEDTSAGVRTMPTMTPTCLYCDEPLTTLAARKKGVCGTAGGHPQFQD